MRFQCPECKGIISVDNADMGSAVQCGHCNMAVTVPPSRVSPGSVVGDFVIMHELGRGGMGIVYQAHQLSLDRSAAVKVLEESYASNTEFVVGFIKEARAAAKLNHPNIVQAYAVGDDEGLFYFAMEHIDGETMKSILKQRNVIPWQESVGIIQQIAEALDYAWQEEKLVHRDIKPDNIMLTSGGRAKLADLGLAKVGDDADGSTDSDEVMGTPQYISPEQLTGDPLDCRTDIYSLGATFYQFLTGRFPYDGSSALEISRKHLEEALVPVREVNPEVPESVSLVVEKMMAKDPAMRYPTPGDLAEDLARIKHGQMPEMATVSTSLKIQLSNQAEAEHAAAEAAAKEAAKEAASPARARPSLSIRKPEAPSAPQAPAPASPAPAPASPAPPKAPTLAKKPSLAKPKAPTPPAPAPAPASPAPPAAEAKPAAEAPKEQQKPAGKKQEKTKKKSRETASSSGGKVVLWILIVLILLLGGFAAYLYFTGKMDAFIAGLKKKDVSSALTALEGEKPPPPSEYEIAAQRLVDQIRSSSPAGNPAFLNQCRAFLLSGKTPANEKEKALEKVIVEFFASSDENSVENARLDAISRYEAAIVRKAAAAAEQARLRQLAEIKRKEAEIKRREQEAIKREEEQKRKAAQRIVDNFKRRMSYLEMRIFTDLNAYSEKNDIEGYRKLLAANLAEAQKAPREWVAYTRSMVSRTRYMEKMLTPGWEWQKLLTDGDPSVQGMNIVLGLEFCKVSAIREGMIYSRSIMGKEINVPVEKYLRNKQFLKFLINWGYKNKKLGALPFYFFWRNEPLIAKEISLECSSREQALYRNFVMTYLRNALKGRHRAKLIRRFGSTEEYQALFPRPKPKPRPRPRKVAPKRPAPRKAAVRKPAAKKPAVKKPAAKKPAAKKPVAKKPVPKKK